MTTTERSWRAWKGPVCVFGLEFESMDGLMEELVNGCRKSPASMRRMMEDWGMGCDLIAYGIDTYTDRTIIICIPAKDIIDRVRGRVEYR